jgi:hypothetical protein
MIFHFPVGKYYLGVLGNRGISTMPCWRRMSFDFKDFLTLSIRIQSHQEGLMTTQTIIMIFTLVIYLIIIFVFTKARSNMLGKVGKVINPILITVCLYSSPIVVIFDQFMKVEILKL